MENMYFLKGVLSIAKQYKNGTVNEVQAVYVHRGTGNEGMARVLQLIIPGGNAIISYMGMQEEIGHAYSICTDRKMLYALSQWLGFLRWRGMALIAD